MNKVFAELCNICALLNETSYKTVIVFIGTSFISRIRVAIISDQAGFFWI